MADDARDAQIRIGQPTPARMYDYFLGGRDNFRVDRAAADRLIARLGPERTRLVAQENRRFLGRTVEYLAGECGISQFIDVGAGMPTMRNTHEIAQAAAAQPRYAHVALLYGSWAEERHRKGARMTVMSASLGEDPAELAAGPAESAASLSADGSSGRQGVPTTTRSIWVLEHVQDWVTVAVGIVLIALAVVLLISGIVDFLDGSSGPISAGAPILLDRVLLVLILVEIVYTVVLSLRAHRLVAQPFIVVGLIAVVRRILFVLTPGSAAVSTAELALLIAMVGVFIAGFVVVSRFEKGDG